MAEPDATFTAPVAVFRVTNGLLLLTSLNVTVDVVAVTPISVSLASTFATATPPAVVTVPLSGLATIAAVTGIAGVELVLLPGFGSIDPAGSVTVAVFAAIVPDAGAVPSTVIVSSFAAPWPMFAV